MGVWLSMRGRKLRNQTGNREPVSVNREPVGTGTGMNRNRSEPEPVCTVLYSTVQYCTVPFIRYRKKNQKRNTNAGGAPRRGDARPPRSCYVFDFCFTHLGSCFGMNGHPRGATDVILRLS